MLGSRDALQRNTGRVAGLGSTSGCVRPERCHCRDARSTHFSSGNDQQSGENTSSAPGGVQLRINITNDGIGDIGDRHLDPNVNASQFSESDLRGLLQDLNTVSTPITKEVQTPGRATVYP